MKGGGGGGEGRVHFRELYESGLHKSLQKFNAKLYIFSILTTF